MVGTMQSKWKPGDEIDGWKLLHRLGDGGSGDVWQASRDGKTVALKLLKPDFQHKENKRFVRFRDEVRMQERLAPSHPGILPVVAYFVPDEPPSDRPVWLATPISNLIKRELKN